MNMLQLPLIIINKINFFKINLNIITYGQALVQAPEANKYPLIQVVDAVDVQTAVLLYY
jgi:hypothetical protein